MEMQGFHSCECRRTQQCRPELPLAELPEPVRLSGRSHMHRRSNPTRVRQRDLPWSTMAFINFLPALPRASEFHPDADPHFTSPLVDVMCYDGILDGNAQ